MWLCEWSGAKSPGAFLFERPDFLHFLCRETITRLSDTRECSITLRWCFPLPKRSKRMGSPCQQPRSGRLEGHARSACAATETCSVVGNHHREREHHTAAASAAAPSTREGIARHKCAQESVQKVKVSLEQEYNCRGTLHLQATGCRGRRERSSSRLPAWVSGKPLQ